jgi:hypothetical protein
LSYLFLQKINANLINNLSILKKRFCCFLKAWQPFFKNFHKNILYQRVFKESLICHACHPTCHACECMSDLRIYAIPVIYVMSENICHACGGRHLFALSIEIPAYAGMTKDSGNDGKGAVMTNQKNPRHAKLPHHHICHQTVMPAPTTVMLRPHILSCLRRQASRPITTHHASLLLPSCLRRQASLCIIH